MSDIRTNFDQTMIRLAGRMDEVLDYPLTIFGAIVSMPETGWAGFKKVALRPFALRDLKKRLIIRATDRDEEAAERQVLADEVDACLAKGDWLELAASFRHLDQTRNATRSGVRHLEIAMQYLRARTSVSFEEPNGCSYEMTFDFSPELISELTELQEDNPDNYALAAILARLHLDCGWAARGSRWADAVGESGWVAMNEHYHRARNIITRFDPVAYNSPLLAEIQYRLCVGLENGRERLLESFTDWSDLDPTNLTVYRQHAYHCLPRWFGDYKTLEQQAEAARLATRDAFGDAAYTVMMMHALRFEDGAAHYLKPDLFLSGLDSLLQTFESNPYRFTATCSELQDALEHQYYHLLGAKRAKKRVAKVIRAGLPAIVRRHLSVFCSVAWDQPEDDFLIAVAPAFSDELDSGATVAVTARGINVIDPEEEAVAA
ncbi:MAG: hypothetical protein HKP40_06110 [Litoreibacter sp.]|nr:hypothetical protein [Litoreibacter sp.]